MAPWAFAPALNRNLQVVVGMSCAASRCQARFQTPRPTPPKAALQTVGCATAKGAYSPFGTNNRELGMTNTIMAIDLGRYKCVGFVFWQANASAEKNLHRRAKELGNELTKVAESPPAEEAPTLA